MNLSNSLKTTSGLARQVINRFGIDTITLAGPLEAKLTAAKLGGFEQIMLSARDLVGHPQGWEKAVELVKQSGLKVTGFQVLRDFEGLSGHLHQYKVDIAQSMLQMCAALGSKVLLCCSSNSQRASGDHELIVRDLRKLAMMALPLGIKVAFEALSWGRFVNDAITGWNLVSQANVPNLGVGLDSYHIFAAQTPLDDFDDFDPDKIYLVQLSDFMWSQVNSFEERMNTARTYRVFPGEGVHSEELAKLVLKLDRLGYQGDYSFEVFNDDYQQLPLPVVTARAFRSAVWLSEDVLHRPPELPAWVKNNRVSL